MNLGLQRLQESSKRLQLSSFIFHILNKLVRPTGVEPVSMASEATILSIELWARKKWEVTGYRLIVKQKNKISSAFIPLTDNK
jgi:hypothetical protein